MEITSLIKDDHIILTQDLSLSEVLSKLTSSEKRVALLFRSNKYQGLFERKNFFRFDEDMHEVKVSKFIKRTPLINNNASIIEAINLLKESNTEHLPVIKDKEIIGVLNGSDVLLAARDLPEIAKLPVTSFKLVKPQKVSPSDSIGTAVTIMREQNIESLPVFANGALEGIITLKELVRKSLNWSQKRDISGKFNAQIKTKAGRPESKSFTDLSLENFIEPAPTKIKNTSTFKDVITAMTQTNLQEMMVIDNNKYIGLLTIHSLLSGLSKVEAPQNFKIRFIGLNKLSLTEHQLFALQKITETQALKLQRKIEGPFTIAVHIREMHKEGKQHEFEVDTKIETVGKVYGSQKVDWDLETAVHRCFNTIKFSSKR